MRAAIDLKSRIHAALAKYNKLNITFTQPPHETQSTKPIPQVVKTDFPPVTDLEWNIGSGDQESESKVEMELDPTTPHAQLARLKKLKQLNV